MNYLIDSHCHLHDREFFTPAQAEQFLDEARANDIRQIIVIGTDPVDSQNALEFANAHSDVFCTCGIHPEFANSHNIEDEWNDSKAKHSLKKLLLGERGLNSLDDESAPELLTCPLVAIGEIGLDYHYEGYNRTQQIQLFEKMLQLAIDLNLPVSLHIREAFDDAWPVLDNFPKIRGVVHSFTGSKRELKNALFRDFYIGVNGLATYTTPPLPPLEKMLLETDAPFLTPVPFRGTINKPGYIRNIADYLSEKLGVAEEIIAEQTTNNAKQLFQLGDPNLL